MCTVRRAHVLVYKGKAEVIEELDKPLRSASGSFIWPHVIRLINYVRVPAGLSLLMLLVFWSTIRGRGEGAYTHVSGRTWDGYALRWLLVSAALFAGSTALYLVRRRGRD